MPQRGRSVLIKIVEIDWASVRQIYVGVSIAMMTLQVNAAGPITLDCQALVMVWKSDDIKRTRLENFSMTIQSTDNRSHVFISGETQIQLDVNEIDQPDLASKGERVDQKIEIDNTNMHVEKLIRQARFTEIHIMNIEIPTGKLRVDSWSSPSDRLIADGRCK